MPSLLDIRDQIDKKEAKASQKKGTRLSNDWELPDDWLEWAVNEGLRQSQAFLEAKKFRDYWVAKSGVGATKCDWLATWRNWVRNTIERQQPKQSKQERISDDIAEFKRAASKAYG